MKSLFAFLFLFSVSVCATTFDSDGTVANILTLQTTASNGDTITIPAGTFTWTTGVTLSRNITIQGAGIGSTTLVGNDLVFPFFSLGTYAATITGIHFLSSGSNSNSATMIYARGQGFRIHDNKFENAGGLTARTVLCNGGTTIPHPTGLIDHNQFFNVKTLVQGNLDLMGNAIWNQSSTIGNPNQTGVVYIEDNYFYSDGSNSDVSDGDYAGRYVFRHNEVHNVMSELHSTRGPGAGRGGKSWEVYANTFFRDVTGAQFAAIWQRNGTGVIYNNTITGSFTNPIALDNVRSFTVFAYPPGDCDGNSNWDGNVDNGWPCRDQIGRGSDATLFSSPPYPSQTPEPVYIWNNTKDGAPTTPNVINNGSAVKPGGSSADIHVDCDYILSPRPGYIAYPYPYPLPTATPTATATATATFTPTPTATATFTPTPSATATSTPTPTPRCDH